LIFQGLYGFQRVAFLGRSRFAATVDIEVHLRTSCEIYVAASASRPDDPDFLAFYSIYTQILSL
jgi:hypothetical protein